MTGATGGTGATGATGSSGASTLIVPYNVDRTSGIGGTNGANPTGTSNLTPYGNSGAFTPGPGDGRGLLLANDCNNADLDVQFDGPPTVNYKFNLLSKAAPISTSSTNATSLVCTVTAGNTSCVSSKAGLGISAGDVIFMQMTGTQAFSAGNVAVYVLLTCKP